LTPVQKPNERRNENQFVFSIHYCDGYSSLRTVQMMPILTTRRKL
jgi:hypothetical protein